MATDALSTTLRVGFASSLERPSIKIAPHPEYNDATLGIPLRVYPPDVSLAASVGTITKQNILTEQIQGEMLRFSGTSEARLTYNPSSSPPDPEFLFGFDQQGEPLLFPPRFEYDLKNGIVRSYRIVAGRRQPLEFYGLVRVREYLAEYLKFYYKPAVEYLKTGMIGVYGSLVTFGVIAAYKAGGIELYEVPTNRGDASRYRSEIYRIVSKTVIDPDGEWEIPEQWGPTYAGKYDNGTDGPQADTAVVKERVHEYGYMDSYGFFHYEAFRRFLLQPFDSSPILISNENTLFFQPKIEMITVSETSLFNDGQKALRDRMRGYLDKRKTYKLILSDYQQLVM